LGALNSLVIIEQANGILAERLQIDVDEIARPRRRLADFPALLFCNTPLRW
jgi:hypothetical protein